MDITPQIPALTNGRKQLPTLMAGTTTEEEGVELVIRKRPSFLFASEQLETGAGLQRGGGGKPISPGNHGGRHQGRNRWGPLANRMGVQALRTTHRGEGKQPLEPLTDREEQVLQILLQGYTNREMAEALSVSAETIKTHVANILGKLQVRDRTHAAVISLRLGLARWD
jgi:DNA-binding CsgD family transcriptional regulator